MKQPALTHTPRHCPQTSHHLAVLARATAWLVHTTHERALHLVLLALAIAPRIQAASQRALVLCAQLAQIRQPSDSAQTLPPRAPCACPLTGALTATSSTARCAGRYCHSGSCPISSETSPRPCARAHRAFAEKHSIRLRNARARQVSAASAKASDSERLCEDEPSPVSSPALSNRLERVRVRCAVVVVRVLHFLGELELDFAEQPAQLVRVRLSAMLGGEEPTDGLFETRRGASARVHLARAPAQSPFGAAQTRPRHALRPRLLSGQKLL